MRHPHRLVVGRPGEEGGLLRVHSGLPELGDTGPLDLAAQFQRHQLHAVADAQRRDAEVEDARVDARRAFYVHRRGPPAEDDGVRIASAHLLGCHLVPDELGVHTTLAHATGDQLRVLPTEIHDEHRPLLRRTFG